MYACLHLHIHIYSTYIHLYMHISEYMPIQLHNSCHVQSLYFPGHLEEGRRHGDVADLDLVYVPGVESREPAYDTPVSPNI